MDLQARIGPKARKLYPNLSWKRPGADLQSPTKKAVNHPSGGKECDSHASNYERRSSQSFSSPNESSHHRNSHSRHRQSTGAQSLLSRMALSPGISDDGASSDAGEAASIQHLLLPGEDTTDGTPPNIGSAENQSLDNRDNGILHDNPSSGQMKYNNGTVAKPSTKETSSPKSLHKSVLQVSSKSNYPNAPSQQKEVEKGEIGSVPNLPPSQEQEFEEGELNESEPLPSQQVRDVILHLVLKNAAHRVKEGDSDLIPHTAHSIDSDLIPHTAHSILSDEICSSFMDQMKEVRTEMHAHKRRSQNPPQMQLKEEMRNPGVVDTSSSKMGQAPPLGPRAMIHAIKTETHIPPNGQITTISSLSKDQPALLRDHSYDPVSPLVHRRHESAFRHTPSPERRGFQDPDQGRRYSLHRDPRFDGHRRRSHSHSPSRRSQGQPYYRPSDSSLRMDRSRSPVTSPRSPRQRRPLPAQTTLFRDRPIRDSPEELSDPRSGSPPGASTQNRIPDRRQSLSREFKRIEGYISPPRDTADSPQSPFIDKYSRSHFVRHETDKVLSRHRASFTQDRGLESDEFSKRRVSICRSGPEFARRSALPPKRRQFSAERHLVRTPPPQSAIPNPDCQSSSYDEQRRREQNAYHMPTTPNRYHLSPSYDEQRRRREQLLPQPDTPNPYCQSSSYDEQRCREQDAYHMETLSPRAGSISSHLTSNAASSSHHQITKLKVIDHQDILGRVNDEVGMGLASHDKLELSVLPCHNVPGVWFVKVALDEIGTLECSFEVDKVTALQWNLGQAK